MALAAGLHGAVRLSFFRAGKVDQFGANFKVRILVDNDVIRPFRKISGKVVVDTRFPIKMKEIVVQFEGMCTLRYSTKLDNRTSFHQSRKCIVEGTKSEVDGYQESPIKQIILDGIEGFYVASTYQSETFTFTLEIPGNPHLPAPFKNSYGNLVYRLVVYMKSTNNIYVEVGEKIMRFNGHHNLLSNVESFKPLTVDNAFKKSLFSRKKLVEAFLSAESSGFLPEEPISFILYVKNPKCIPLELAVQLVQYLKFDATGKRDSPKKRFCIPAVKEKGEIQSDPEVTWIDDLMIPAGQEPSFAAHQMYNILYSIQFKVKIQDHGTIKGEAPIFIGTTRDPIQILMNNANGLDVPFQGLGRRGSVSSTHSVSSHGSVHTTFSLPPAYSQLSSRIPSMETLPPAYDEVEILENTQEESEITLQVPSLPSSPSPEGSVANSPTNGEAETVD